MSYFFLLDTLRALHHNVSPQFCRSELFITMPASNHDFYDIYSRLINEGQGLPTNLTQAEDAALLLAALLSDLIMVHRASTNFDLAPVDLPDLQTPTSRNPLPNFNPYVPFSAATESKRMWAQLERGLELWHERFKQCVSEDVLALFHFCRLFSSYPQVLSLPFRAGYRPAVDTNTSATAPVPGAAVGDATMRHVWLVVDHINVERLSDRAVCPVWLPVITYLTALVMWANLRTSSTSRLSHGTLKVLGLFKMELQHVPWPCCTEMIKNLDDLMRVTD